MNVMDLVVIIGVVLAALGGFRVGFLARVASWIGLGVGFYVSLRIVPTVLSSFSLPTASGRLLVAITVLVVGTFIGQAIGLIVGHRIRGVLPLGGARTADRVFGSVAGGVSILLALWLFVPALADVAGWPSRQARGSVVAQAVTNVLPDPPDATQSVRRLIDERGFPRVFDALQPAPDAGLPPVDPGLSPEVVASVRAATVKVMGEACARIQEGSGFVISENVIVTNAHVVAGEPKVDIVRPDGKRLRAAVAVFDARARPSCPPSRTLGHALARPRQGVRRRDGSRVRAPRRSGGRAGRARPDQQRSRGQGGDIYGDDTVRQIFILAANLRPGDSGGPFVDEQGRVVGVAFAIAPDRPGTAYALTGAELDAVLDAYNRAPTATVDTRSCLK